ncbi:hypothetical protein TNCV_4674901 [Trichonephila clavipes]|nr:hypothetical protein TNCV_4674901 [Trichonephila clavipes]
MSRKKKLSLQEALELLESLPSESSDAPTDDSSEEVPAKILLEFSSNSEEDDEEIEQDLGYSSLYSENTAFPTSGCIRNDRFGLPKLIDDKKMKKETSTIKYRINGLFKWKHNHPAYFLSNYHGNGSCVVEWKLNDGTKIDVTAL